MATDPRKLPWLAANQAYLRAGVEAMAAMLKMQAEVARPLSPAEVDACCQAHFATAAAQLPAPAAIDHLQALFGLSPLEQRTLLLCLSAQLDPRIHDLCSERRAAAQRHDSRFAGAGPSFGLLRSLWADFDWQALLPSAPLRHWRFIEVQDPTALLDSPLLLDERILHFSMGLQTPDDRIAIALRGSRSAMPRLTASQQARVDRLLPAWSGAIAAQERPLILLEGQDLPAQLAAAQQLGRAVANGILRCNPAALAPPSADLADALRLVAREALLQNRLLMVEGLDAPSLAAQATLIGDWIDHLSGAAFIMATLPGWKHQRPQWVLRMNTPTRTEQAALWREGLPATTAAGGMRRHTLADTFDLPGETIQRICTRVGLDPEVSPEAMVVVARDLCREETRPRLAGLVQRLSVRATWRDLVVPAGTRTLLEAIAGQVGHRHRVFKKWAFDRKTPRGTGLAALFCGASGTGKTLAAEILAHELEMDLYQVELSQVVDKYIGETEKHLARIFDAAEQGGSILLLDEADALFGKRSEVRDSHDRHANIEVSYLLQRMERFKGLAILTTNMRAAIDEAFLRRLRFIVNFPFPDREQRQAIWAHIFPAQTPLGDLDLARLAQLSVSGGGIHNIALQAAFLAAQNGGRIEMGHLAAAARMEYAKLERPLTPGETGGWL